MDASLILIFQQDVFHVSGNKGVDGDKILGIGSLHMSLGVAESGGHRGVVIVRLR